LTELRNHHTFRVKRPPTGTFYPDGIFQAKKV